MDFASLDFKVDALQDVILGNFSFKSLNLEHFILLFELLAHSAFELEPEKLSGFDSKFPGQLPEYLFAEPVNDRTHRIFLGNSPLLE